MLLPFRSFSMPRLTNFLPIAVLIALASCGSDQRSPLAVETALPAGEASSASAADNNRPALQVLTAPAGAVAGHALVTQPVIELRNKGGNLVMGNKSVTASLVGGAGVLSGTTTVSLVRGVATFTNLAISPAGDYTLLFTSDSFTPVSVAVAVAPSTFLLSVVTAGAGTVLSTPAGITCGSTCSAAFAAGSLVTLNALADSPTTTAFTGWSGACSGVAACVVTMDAAKSVTATFTPIGPPSGTFALTITMDGAGGGSVISDNTISIGGGGPFGPPPVVIVNSGDELCTSGAAPCLLTFPETGVYLTLVALPGGTWSGDCEGYLGGSTCDVDMHGSKSVSVTIPPAITLAASALPGMSFTRLGRSVAVEDGALRGGDTR